MQSEEEAQEPVPDPSQVRILSQQRLFDDFFAIDRYVYVQQNKTGEPSEPVARLVFERGDSSAVLPYDPRTQQLVLVKQFRLPAFVRHRCGWLWEMIAGSCDDERDPAAVARDEALEEAGYHLGELHPLMSIFPSPGGTSERIYLFWSDLGRAERVGPGGGLPKVGEETVAGRFSLTEALGMVRDGIIVDAKTIVVLQHLALYKGYPGVE